MAQARELTFEERVRAQESIERVSWNHRIWPAQNPGPKPPLSAVLPESAIRDRVENYLKMSNALASRWQIAITAEQLQAEIERMSIHTQDARALTELYGALGNDPQLIAETLGRATLAERLLRDRYALDARLHGDVRRQAEAAVARFQDAAAMDRMGGAYSVVTLKLRTAGESTLAASGAEGHVLRLTADQWTRELARIAALFGTSSGTIPTGRLSGVQEDVDGFHVNAVLAISADSLTLATVTWEKIPFSAWWARERETLDATVPASTGTFSLPAPATATCTDAIATWDTWEPTATGGPGARNNHTAVWTGTEMIVWGGYSVGGWLNSGGRYNPATDSWLPTSTGSQVPSERAAHTAVWTGTEMIVWGGVSGAGRLNTGGRYDPATDSWAPTSTGTNVPSPRADFTAVWTGTQMVVWGGWDAGTGGIVYTNSGGRYDPSSDGWSPTSLGSNVPSVRAQHTAVWTGAEMIVWGGWTTDVTGAVTYLNTGGRYDPSADSWTPTPTGAGVPTARGAHTAVWTDTEMIVWGGKGPDPLSSGGRLAPSTNTWSAVAGFAAPAGRFAHTAIWTGAEMIVWGGFGGTGILDTGGRYNPTRDQWRATSTAANLPSARQYDSAIWTGTEMIVWGGAASSGYVDSGSRYCVGLCAPLVFYQDGDSDHFGNQAVSALACDSLDGYVLNALDCDDTDAAIHPGATEVCNGHDDDCNGVVDDGGNSLCDDGVSCTADVCHGATGCSHDAVSGACAATGDVCTAGSCDVIQGCVFNTVNVDTEGFSSNRVDGKDLAVLAAAWNSCPNDASFNPAVNFDVATPCVDLTDFHSFMQAFGRSCP